MAISASTSTPNSALAVCKNRSLRLATTSRAQAKPSGNATLSKMPGKIPSRRLGGRKLLNTSSSAATQAMRASRNGDAGRCAGVCLPQCNFQKCFCESQHTDSVIIHSKLYTWITACPMRFGSIESEQLVQLAQALEPQESIGVDTEFLRERTFFPRLCLLQLSAGSRIWCVDTLQGRRPRRAAAHPDRAARAQDHSCRTPGPRSVVPHEQAGRVAGIRYPDRRRRASA